MINSMIGKKTLKLAKSIIAFNLLTFEGCLFHLAYVKTIDTYETAYLLVYIILIIGSHIAFSYEGASSRPILINIQREMNDQSRSYRYRCSHPGWS